MNVCWCVSVVLSCVSRLFNVFVSGWILLGRFCVGNGDSVVVLCVCICLVIELSGVSLCLMVSYMIQFSSGNRISSGVIVCSVMCVVILCCVLYGWVICIMVGLNVMLQMCYGFFGVFVFEKFSFVWFGRLGCVCERYRLCLVLFQMWIMILLLCVMLVSVGGGGLIYWFGKVVVICCIWQLNSVLVFWCVCVQIRLVVIIMFVSRLLVSYYSRVL